MQISQSHIALAIRASAIAAVLIVFFREDLAVVFNDALRNDTTSYILAVPFMFAYLIWRKRKMLKAAISTKEEGQSGKASQMPMIAGILLSMVAIFLYWYGSYTFTPLEYHIVVLPILAAGLILVIFNYQTLRQLLFPLFFLFLLTPPPEEVLFALGQTLPIVSSEVSNKMLNILGVRSTLSSEYGSPTIILTRPNSEIVSFVVDVACSGIYSLIGFLLCIVFIVYVIRDKPWKKLALFLIGFPLVYLLNILRIAAMVLIGYYAGGDIALQIFHLLGGWVLMFLGTLMLLGISERAFKTKILSYPTEKCSQCTSSLKLNQSFCFKCARILNPPITFDRSDLARLTVVASAVFLLLSIQVPVFALTQGPALVTIDTPSGPEFSTDILPKLSEYSLTYVTRDMEFEKLAKQDMALAYLYTPFNRSNEGIIVRIEIASTLSSLHREETCLVTWAVTQGIQPAWTQLDLRDIQLIENPLVTSRFCVFNKRATDEKRVVLYWYESATFGLNSTLQQKYVKISLLALPENLDNLSAMQNQMVALAQAIAIYWEPIKEWSPIAVFMSRNGIYLAMAASALLAATVITYVLEIRKQKRTNANGYRKLSRPDQRIIDMVYLAEKTAIPTLEAILTKCNGTAGESISKEELLRRLVEAGKIGLVRSSIRNENDEPMRIWKTSIKFK